MANSAIGGIAGRLTRAAMPVTARKDDVPTAYQAATTNIAGLMTISGGGGLIQTTSG